ncbi:MAG: cupin domain-containing protein [Candidatus Latescibacteria bacterium]|nr:cupin domain-containing protein [Candidatus Latescibacterota bacterium]
MTILVCITVSAAHFFTDAAAQEKPAAQTAAAAVKLANLLRTELQLAEGVEVIVSMVEIPPNSQLPRHYHPGEEFVYILEGSGTLWQKDKADTPLQQGDIFKIPLKQVHTAKTGADSVKALVFRIHKKGEPERIPSN